MSSTVQRMLALVVSATIVLTCTAAGHAQATSKWENGAPFPEPAEELYGVATNGKMYVIGGFGEGGRPMGIVYEYDAGADKWTKKKSMPMPAHHAALAEYNGKIYVFAGFVAHATPGQPGGGWQPVDNGQTTSWDPPEAWKFITQF